MKNKTIIYSVIAVAIIGLNACQKDQGNASEVLPPMENFEKLKKFVSNTSGIPEESLLYNKSTKDFYIENTVFRISLEDVQKYYEVANLYKAKYEGN